MTNNKTPLHIVYRITHRCNLKCKFCWFHRPDYKPEIPINTSNELSTSEVKTFFNQIKDYPLTLNITGGEPFLRDDFIELLHYAADIQLNLSVISNATILKNKNFDILFYKQNIKQIIFSIDGPEHINDTIRGNGTYNSVNECIDRIQTFKAKHNLQWPEPVICTVISNDNSIYLKDFALMYAKKGISLRIQHLMWASEKLKEKHNQDINQKIGLKQSFIDGFPSQSGFKNITILKDFINWHSKLDNKERRLITIVPELKDEQIQPWYFDDEYNIKANCYYPKHNIRIEPDGSIQSCPYIPYYYGHIFKDDIKSILNGEKAKSFQSLCNKSIFPGCVRCCKLNEFDQ